MTAVLADEGGLTLAIGFLTVLTHVARTRGIARVNRMQRDGSLSGLVGKELTELPKGPGSMPRSLRPSYRALGAGPNVSKVFDGYCLPVGFGLLDNPFGDHMIGVAFETGFTPREFLEVAPCRLSAAHLQALSEGVHLLSIVFNGLSAKRLTCAIGGKVDNAQVNAEGIRRLLWRWCGNIQRHGKGESPTTIEQIGLSFDLINAGLLIATHTERDQDTTLQGQEGDFTESLKGHQALIIGDSTLAAEGRFDALITLVDLCGFADRTNSHLRRESVLLADIAIHQLLQLGPENLPGAHVTCITIRNRGFQVLCGGKTPGPMSLSPCMAIPQ